MENAHTTRAGSRLPKRQSSYKKQFIQYEPETASELNDKKSGKQSVSGRLLTLLYARLTYWSRYAKWVHKGRRYFWKSISELSSELFYSEKQVSRGLKALEELGMIKREQLNKHNWKRQYFYYLPKSVHTAEAEAPEPTTATRSISTSRSSSRFVGEGGSGGGQASVATTSQTALTEASGREQEAPAEMTAASTGADASTPNHQPHQASGGSIRTMRQHRSGHFDGVNNIRNNPLLTNHLQTIVEKCLDYATNPPKPLTGKGIGFAT